jgi:hypothetical protein
MYWPVGWHPTSNLQNRSNPVNSLQIAFVHLSDQRGVLIVERPLVELTQFKDESLCARAHRECSAERSDWLCMVITGREMLPHIHTGTHVRAVHELGPPPHRFSRRPRQSKQRTDVCVAITRPFALSCASSATHVASARASSFNTFSAYRSPPATPPPGTAAPACPWPRRWSAVSAPAASPAHRARPSTQRTPAAPWRRPEREPQAALLPPSRLQQLQHLGQQLIRQLRPPALLHRRPPLPSRA